MHSDHDYAIPEVQPLSLLAGRDVKSLWLRNLCLIPTHPPTHHHPQGESHTQFKARCVEGMEKIAECHCGQTVTRTPIPNSAVFPLTSVFVVRDVR